MRLLVLHQDFPGQFRHMVEHWVKRPGWDVRGLGLDTAPGIAGFDRLTRYRPAREVRGNQHPYLRTMGSAVLNGQQVARELLRMKQQGFTPETVLAEVKLDPTRAHFLERVPRAKYVKVLHVSAAHVYLTYPFVLSWSLLEAMVCGASLVVSGTAPLREVIHHGRTALVAPFHDVDRLTRGVGDALEMTAYARGLAFDACRNRGGTIRAVRRVARLRNVGCLSRRREGRGWPARSTRMLTGTPPEPAGVAA